MRTKTLLLLLVGLGATLQASAQCTSNPSVVINSKATATPDCVEIPAKALGSGFALTWDKDPNDPPDTFKVHFEEAFIFKKVIPCVEKQDFDEKNKTCHVNSTSFPKESTCPNFNDPNKFCYQYKVKVTTKNQTIEKDPQVIVDSSRGNPPEPPKR